MKKLTTLLVLLFAFQGFSQELTGEQLLEKSIEYHDPNRNWETFNGVLNVTMKTPKNDDRKTLIKINLPEEYFYVKAKRGKNTTEYTVEKNSCTISFNEKNLTEAQKKEHKLSCKRASLYKNYYTYLYGLPMKLKDNGTIIHDKIELKKFNQKEYLVLKVSYDEKVGSVLGISIST